jgi:hypothetical protein
MISALDRLESLDLDEITVWVRLTKIVIHLEETVSRSRTCIISDVLYSVDGCQIYLLKI